MVSFGEGSVSHGCRGGHSIPTRLCAISTFTRKGAKCEGFHARITLLRQNGMSPHPLLPPSVTAFMTPPLSAAQDEPTELESRYVVGQFVSRSFNFVYVLVTCLWLVLVPFSINTWPLGSRVLWLVAVAVGDLIVVQGFKHICYFPRPNTTNPFRWGRHANSGFPSGHTLPAFLGATLIWQTHPQLWFWFLGAALIGWARWNVKAHFGYQVTLSALLGIGIGLLAGRFL